MIGEKVVVRYEADTSQHVAQLRSLEAQQSRFGATMQASTAKISTGLADAEGKADSLGKTLQRSIGDFKAASFITSFTAIAGIIGVAVGAALALKAAIDSVGEAGRQAAKEYDDLFKAYTKSDLARDASRDAFYRKRPGYSSLENALGANDVSGFVLNSFLPSLPSGAREPRAGRGGGGRDLANMPWDPIIESSGFELGGGLAGGRNWFQRSGAGSGALTGTPGEMDLLTADERYANFQAKTGANTSMLASMLGPIDEINGYRDAFEGLKTVVSDAFAAWVTGSMSVGQAIKQAISGVLLAEGQKMAVLALEHAAYGIGALAVGGPVAGASAAAHFKAAALFGAGAVAAGVAAKAVGGFDTGGGGAPSLGAPTLSGGGGGRNITVILGDDFADDSPRTRAKRAERTIRRALDDTRQPDGVYRG